MLETLQADALCNPPQIDHTTALNVDNLETSGGYKLIKEISRCQKLINSQDRFFFRHMEHGCVI